jgi:hypothetical protein
MRHAFIDSNGIVVNVIVGALTDSQRTQFLADYGRLFNAVACIEVFEETPVWIGGSYTDGIFNPPPVPEPLPEPLPEPQPEPEI